jgi:hypothetical protein
VNTIAKVLLYVGAVAALVPTAAHSTPRFYATVSAGQGNGVDLTDTGRALYGAQTNELRGAAFSGEERSTGRRTFYELGLGVDVNRFFALEVMHQMNTAKSGFEVTALGRFPDNPSPDPEPFKYSARLKDQAISFNVIGRWPVTERVGVFARTGIAYVRTNLSSHVERDSYWTYSECASRTYRNSTGWDFCPGDRLIYLADSHRGASLNSNELGYGFGMFFQGQIVSLRLEYAVQGAQMPDLGPAGLRRLHTQGLAARFEMSWGNR